MKGELLAGDTNRGRSVTFYFIELEEDVAGCSADGLGKTGHCVVVSAKDIKKTTTFKLSEA